MSEKDKADFERLFDDYELVQPFLQLKRPISLLSQAERGQSTINRWVGKSVPGGNLMALYWRTVNNWGSGGDTFTQSLSHNLHLAEEGQVCRAHLSFKPGLDIYQRSGQDKNAQFTLGELPLAGLNERAFRPLFGQVEPILMSEVLSDLESL